MMDKYQDCEDIEATVLLDCMERLNQIDPLAMQRVVRYLFERCVVRLEAERKAIDESIEWVKQQMEKPDDRTYSARREGLVPMAK